MIKVGVKKIKRQIFDDGGVINSEEDMKNFK
jgi:hypothetical protein